ncbi:phage portal protein [Sphingomonas sp. BE137]|uniref:phage portal protein n=1 Tax=Sphingomonas sp. BE137 TaxID=2817844 RepID=UPI0028644CB5|nr:phage portal protein [Sphingomonas sp. BE137]MDR6850381.1 lambda family phage portal protein [Sphingomonas sp. BE137]
MATAPAILDSRGRAIPSQAIAKIRSGASQQRGGMSASLSGPNSQFFPYDAANYASQEYGDWFPATRSPDSEININRDRITGRARDLFRNDAWAKGAISRILDSTIGASYRLVSKPDYRALSLYNKAFDAEWAEEYRRAVEALWRNYADDLGHYNDVGRKLTVSQQFRLALGHKLVDGESLIVAQWRPDRVYVGGARYATCFQGIDPDRLSNPYQGPDTRFMRNGVEIDRDEVPIAYHIRKAHQFDWYNAVESMQWDRVYREDPEDGWRRVYHDYDPDRFAQSRGMSIFAPVIGRMKMLARYYGVELSAATVASAFGLYVTSPFDVDMVRSALEGADDSDDPAQSGMGWYQDMRTDFHNDRNLQVNDVKIASLAPGEKIETVSATRPNSGFSPFTHEMLRGVAAVLGMSGEQVHNDYSEASWSSARAGIVEAEKTFVRRTAEFSLNTASPMFATWLEEPFNRGMLPLPRSAPSYMEARTAYARCRWLGAARGWVDPVAERQGEVLGMAAGFSTLEEVSAKQGTDWEENLEQRGVEMRRMHELNLPFPQWMNSTETATDSAATQKTQEA